VGNKKKIAGNKKMFFLKKKNPIAAVPTDATSPKKCGIKL
jgi:hypothetical protein